MDEKLALSWSEVIQLSEQLGRRILDYCRVHGTGADAILILPTGGLIPGERVAKVLGLGDLDVIFAGIEAYKPDERHPSGTITTSQLPSEELIRGKRIWIVDEVCDTGVTLRFAVKHLTSLGATEVHTAVLHYKPSKTTTGLVPDVYMVETQAKWIDYPWETVG